MSNITKRFSFVILMAFMLLGCFPAQPKISDEINISFHELVSINNLNKYFDLVVDSTNKELAFGSDIRIRIQNKINQQILFPVDLGIRLFIIRNNGWIEIQNNDKYYNDGSLLILNRQGQMGDSISSGLRPVLPPGIDNTDDKEILRILITGELISDGISSGEQVGAYVDVVIK